MKRKAVISVIGGHDIDQKVEQIAHDIGKIIASMGYILLCGGLDGVMSAASKGARDAGGLTIGLLPGIDKRDANPYIDIPLPTTIGYARNAMVACCADVIVALPGSHGTSCEISYGMVYKKPVIDLGGWKREGMIAINGIEELESKLKELMAEID